jgi:hypothetical protein
MERRMPIDAARRRASALLVIAEQNPKRSLRSQKTQGRAYRAKPLALPSEWVFSFSASMFADFVAV